MRFLDIQFEIPAEMAGHMLREPLGSLHPIVYQPLSSSYAGRELTLNECRGRRSFSATDWQRRSQESSGLRAVAGARRVTDLHMRPTLIKSFGRGTRVLAKRRRKKRQNTKVI